MPYIYIKYCNFLNRLFSTRACGFYWFNPSIIPNLRNCLRVYIAIPKIEKKKIRQLNCNLRPIPKISQAAIFAFCIGVKGVLTDLQMWIILIILSCLIIALQFRFILVDQPSITWVKCYCWFVLPPFRLLSDSVFIIIGFGAQPLPNPKLTDG